MPRGSCACELISISVDTPPQMTLVCSCVDCRKNAGYTGQLLAKYPTEEVMITDPNNYLKTYIVEKTQSGKPKHKLFCGNCGCTIATKPQQYEGKVTILRSCLFDEFDDMFAPKKEIFTGDKWNIEK